jgi:hypothetical protein
MANLQGSPGSLWIEARRSGIDTHRVMMLVDSGVSNSASRDVRVVPATLRPAGETETELVLQLMDLIGRGSRHLSAADRRDVEILLDKISNLRSGTAMAQGTSGHVMVYRLHLLASTGVSAKALSP